MKNPEIFIHTGMGRTGSTFLQYKVFPKFEGICYTQRTKFRRAVQIIQKGRHKKYLISGEMEYKKLERHMREFSSYFPNARPIIILRRHDEWIASQYRRFVKSGHAFKFNEFFNVKNDNAYWEKEWLRYMGNIEILENYFTHKPMVFFYDDLRNDPAKFITQLAEVMSVKVDISDINLSPKHASYNEKQLRAVYTVSKRIKLVKHKPSSSKTINVLINLLKNSIRYTTLYTAPIIPDSWLSSDVFLPDSEELTAIKNYFTEDWDACRQYAGQNNPTLTV